VPLPLRLPLATAPQHCSSLRLNSSRLRSNPHPTPPHPSPPKATYNTVPEWPNKASAFIVFPDVRAACRASSILRDETAVDAVELFDRWGFGLVWWGVWGTVAGRTSC
jgi:hypothetical protein